MINRDEPQGPGTGPLDQPERDAGDPIGDDAYPGGSGMLPPTGDMDDPPPTTGTPAGAAAGEDQLADEEELGPEDQPAR